MIFQFDTNIILHYLKQTPVMHQVETDFNPFQPENECWACVVTIGELRSIEYATIGVKNEKIGFKIF